MQEIKPEVEPTNNLPRRLAVVENLIAELANVTTEQIHSKARHLAVNDARHAIWYLGHDYLGYSYSYLGNVYNRDHTTVIHGVKKMRLSPKAPVLVAYIKHNSPDDVFNKPGSGEPRTIESWDL